MLTEMPKWNPINVCSYHLQEAGATPVQELVPYGLGSPTGLTEHQQVAWALAQELWGGQVGDPNPKEPRDEWERWGGREG